ncbi:hypothetical protein [Anaerocellum diazotrophicum]|uniref:Uncharacterized protein n=1 Tax=Caldicellulosiruptor diazotrophicus TaxID=2806205 RepID=A0ABM7NQC6_9FIRM|nr:hypothetical protein [Caldicellulosiruptor diazotrophicus]BCS82377.1 hypothetical protein CaldiYA01_23370 [Caldicellulosiruptor diazotrophicus]
MKVAWSATHQEFLITDGYYFSGLYKELFKRKIEIKEVDDFNKLFEYDVIVFNYPENPFSNEEKEKIREALQQKGKKIIFTAHFKNKDGVSEICNSITKEYGINILPEGIKDKVHHLEDDLFIITTDEVKLYQKGVKEVVFPYSAPLEVGNGAEIILRARKTSLTDSGKKSPVLIAQKRFESGGKLIVCGSCIFWDNFSLFRLDNLQFVVNIFGGAE